MPLINEHFLPAKVVAQEAVNVIEFYFNRQIQSSSRWADHPGLGAEKEILEIAESQQLKDQVGIVWRLVSRQIPAIWFTRRKHPVSLLFSAMCVAADVSTARILNGHLTEEDFPLFTEIVGKFAGSFLWFCEVNQASFLDILPELNSWNLGGYGICDWILECEEIEAAQKLAEKNLLTFLCPRV